MTTTADQLRAYRVLCDAVPTLNPIVALDTLVIVADMPRDAVVSLLRPATGKVAAYEIASLLGAPLS